MTVQTKAKLRLIASLFIFGTIGTFRKYIPLPSSLIVISRGFLGAISLLVLQKAAKKTLEKTAVRTHLPFLLLAGAALGFNWMLSFESYRFTTVAIGTLCLYMGPIFLILLSPFLLKERLTRKKIIDITIAFIGMLFVSGIFTNDLGGSDNIRGILFGLGSAVFYAPVILLNKKTANVPAYDKTIIQLLAATAVLLPYTLLTVQWEEVHFTRQAVFLLLILSIVHTGIGYALHFGSMKHIEAQSIALLSYIDPVVSILLSVFFLHEPIGIAGIIGAAMILGATLANTLQ